MVSGSRGPSVTLNFDVSLISGLLFVSISRVSEVESDDRRSSVGTWVNRRQRDFRGLGGGSCPVYNSDRQGEL